jgi:hypothetical protein
MAVMCGPAFVLSVFVGLTQGNPLAWGLAIGFAAPIVGTFLLVVPARPAPRKADPEKIARLERELGIVEPPRMVAFTERIDVGGGEIIAFEGWRPADEQEAEAPTTVAKPPTEYSVDDCPRPSGPPRKPSDAGRSASPTMIAPTARQYRGIQ